MATLKQLTCEKLINVAHNLLQRHNFLQNSHPACERACGMTMPKACGRAPGSPAGYDAVAIFRAYHFFRLTAGRCNVWVSACVCFFLLLVCQNLCLTVPDRGWVTVAGSRRMGLNIWNSKLYHRDRTRRVVWFIWRVCMCDSVNGHVQAWSQTTESK